MHHQCTTHHRENNIILILVGIKMIKFGRSVEKPLWEICVFVEKFSGKIFLRKNDNYGVWLSLEVLERSPMGNPGNTALMSPVTTPVSLNPG